MLNQIIPGPCPKETLQLLPGGTAWTHAQVCSTPHTAPLHYARETAWWQGASLVSCSVWAVFASQVCLAHSLLQRGEVVEFHVSLLLNPVSSRNPANSGCQERSSRSLTSSPAGAALSRPGRLAHLADPSILNWHPVRSEDCSPHRGGAQPTEAIGLELATVGAVPSSSPWSGCGRTFPQVVERWDTGSTNSYHGCDLGTKAARWPQQSRGKSLSGWLKLGGKRETLWYTFSPFLFASQI